MTNPDSVDDSRRAGWDRATRALDRHHLWVLAAIIALYVAVTVIRSRATPLWHDEIYTVLLSRQPDFGAVWRAAKSGADAAPPLNLFLTHVAESLAGRGSVVARAPAMIAYCVMSVVIFYVVRARSTVVLAFAALLVPWYTRGYRYSYEARGYGVMLGLFALLLLSWSHAAGGRRRRLWLPVFAVVCAASLWNHYYAALTFVPIACGEIYRWTRRGSPDWPMCAAATIGALGCMPLVPLAHQAAREATTYWRATAWSDVGDTYWLFFHDLWSINPWILAVLGAFVVIGPGRSRWTLRPPNVPGHEVVAAAIALAIPVLAVGVGRLNGAYTPRYALSVVVAWSIVVPATLWWISRRSAVFEVLLLTTLTAGVIQASTATLRHPPVFQDPFAERPLLAAYLHASEPVIVDGAILFLQLWYYAPSDLRSRLWYVADPARSLHYLGSDTADRGFVRLARVSPVGIKTYEQLRDQQSFILYDDGTGWLRSQLRDAGAATSVLGSEGRAQIVHVTWPGHR